MALPHAWGHTPKETNKSLPRAERNAHAWMASIESLDNLSGLLKVLTSITHHCLRKGCCRSTREVDKRHFPNVLSGCGVEQIVVLCDTVFAR